MDVTTQVLTSTPDAVPQSLLSGPAHAGNPVQQTAQGKRLVLSRLRKELERPPAVFFA